MGNLLYDEIRKSNKTLQGISNCMQLSVDELVDKIFKYDLFTIDEAEFLVKYIPLSRPIKVFVEYGIGISGK